MRIVFRADASPQIGSGHVMRVSTIASAAIRAGYECLFIGRTEDLPWVHEYTSTLGFKKIWKNPDDYVSNSSEDVLILDSYTESLASNYTNLANWKFVVCIKDEFTPLYPADLYIKQTLKDDQTKVGVNEVIGPNYSLMRSGIRKTDRDLEKHRPPVIMVIGGGSDPFGFIAAALEVLNGFEVPLVVHVFSNETIEHYHYLSVTRHPIGMALDVVANEVDVVLSPASTSSIEFIAREIPTLIACAVDNQESFYSELSDLGYAIPIGLRTTEGIWKLDDATIKQSIMNVEIRSKVRDSIRGLIDLNGPSRVLSEIEIRLTKGEVRR